LKKGTAALRRNLEDIEKHSHEIDEMIQMSINYLTEYRSWWLQYIQTEKETLSAAIEAAVQETTSCLDLGATPVSALSRALWVLPPEELQVVYCSVTIPDLQDLYILSKWTTGPL